MIKLIGWCEAPGQFEQGKTPPPPSQMPAYSPGDTKITHFLYSTLTVQYVSIIGNCSGDKL